MSDDNLSEYAGVLYIRSTDTGRLCRFNVSFTSSENLSGDDRPDAVWRFEVTTTTPVKFVQTAR